MATSPLQAALKPVGVTESSPADEAYSTAMQQLMSTLEARQNRGSSNTLLAIAEGLLSPTPTGSFGEGLGQAAKAVRGVQAQQEKEQMDLAQMRLQLAQGQREQAQLAAAQQAFRQKSGLVPTQGAAGQAAGQPTGQTPDMKTVSLNDALEFIAAFPNQKELGARMMEAAKTGLDRYSMSMNGIVFDKFAGKYLNVDIPGQKQEPYDTAYGKFNMTPNEYARFDMAQKIGMGGEWMNAFKRGDHFNVDQIVAQKMESKQTSAPVATPPITTEEKTPSKAPGRLTVSEQAIQEERGKTLSRKGAESEQIRTDEVMASGKSAKALLPIYDRTEKLLKEPGMDQVMGVLKRGDVLSGIGNLLNESLRVGNFSVGVPAIKQILTESGVDQRIIDRASEVGQLLAITQFEQRKGLGSGTSVSNFEQQMVNAMGPNLDDTLRTFNQKLKFLKEKSNFESSLSSALRKSKLTYDEFEDTKEFQRMFDSYREKQMNIAYPTGVPKGAAPSTGPITPSMLKERLGIK
jgi:hypothetical protein